MNMELDDCITKDCSTIYRFQFASIAFLCGVYLPLTFHSTIWSLYVQPLTSINCTMTTSKHLLYLGSINNMTTRSLTTATIKFTNRSDCCPCSGIVGSNDKRLLAFCQEWLNGLNEFETRKATIIDEWHLACGQDNRKSLMLGSISFLVAETIGVLIVGILADQYGRKLMLLMCLYIPVLFGSLAAFTTTYSLFIILRWPVGFLNKGLLLLGFIMVIESCEYRHRAQIGCLLLASIPIFGIIVGVTYFFLLDWRLMQLFGTLISTLTLCYPWLIPESRRWYVNSHRVSRVNKFLQFCSTKPSSSSLGLNKIGSPTANTIIYDKPILSRDALRVQTGSLASLFLEQRLRTITCCLSILWILSSFCYRCTLFPTILPHPAINFVLMNAVEFFSFILALIVAYRIGRRAPLAVLILISGLSSVSLAITLLGTGHTWLEITFALVARGCLRTCYCILILFTSELYPTSVRGIGLAIGLAGEVLSRISVELLLYFAIDRTLLLFVSGGILCLSCCLVFPLPETILYDLPDSLTDLESMTRSTTNESGGDMSPPSQHHLIDSNTLTLSGGPRSSTTTASDLNDLSSPPHQQQPPTPKTILKSQQQQQQQQQAAKSVTIHSQPEIIQLNSNKSTLNALSNPCYFASLDDAIDQFDIEQRRDNRVVISIRGVQQDTTINNNNNNNSEDEEATKF